VNRISLDARPLPPAGAVSGAYWTIVQETGAGPVHVVRIDPSTLRPQQVPVDGYPWGLAAGFGSVWVSTCADPGPSQGVLCHDGRLLRFEPLTGRIQAHASIDGFLYPIATGDGAVWVGDRTDEAGTSLVRVDPDTLATRSYPMDPMKAIGASQAHGTCCIYQLTVGGGSVWMNFSGHLARLDPSAATSELLPFLVVGAMTYGDGALWVQAEQGRHVRDAVRPGGIFRIDPTTEAASGPFAIDPHGTLSISSLAIDTEGWAAGVRANVASTVIHLRQFDPVSGAASDRWMEFPFGQGRFGGLGLRGQPSVGLTLADGVAWLANEDSGEVLRVNERWFDANAPTASPARTIVRIPMHGREGGLVYGGGAVWTIPGGGGSHILIRVDAATDRVTTLRFDGQVMRPGAFGDGSFWVALCPGSDDQVCPDAFVLRLDPATEREVARIHVGALLEPADIAVGDDGIAWVLDWHPGAERLIGIDETTDRLSRSIALPDGGSGPLRYLYSPWVVGRSLYRVSTRGHGAGAIAGLTPCGRMAVTDDAVWVGAGCDGHSTLGIARVDPGPDAVTALVPFPDRVMAIGADVADVWTAGSDGFSGVVNVYRLDLRFVDPFRDQISIAPKVGPSFYGWEGGPWTFPLSIAVGGGSTWVTDHAGGDIVRITPAN
jgi:hypothetical protein